LIINIKFFCWLFIIMIILVNFAGAENLTFCGSIPMNFPDWESSVTLPKFDPEMGTLKRVDLLCEMNLTQTIMVENEGFAPAEFNISIHGALTAELPSSQNISLNISHISKGNLSGYDGVSDYKGVSGINSSEIIPIKAPIKSMPNIADFLAVSPGERITIPVAVNISSLMGVPASSSSGIAAKAGAQVCIYYTYEAKSTKKGGEL